MKILIRLIPLLLSCNLIQAQDKFVDSLQHDVDSYKKEDSIHVKKLIALARSIPNTNQEKAETIYKQALDLSVKLGWKKGEVICYQSLSGFYSGRKQFDKNISAGLKAIDIANEINDSTLIASSGIELGDSYRYLGDLQQAETYILKALAIAKLIRNQNLILSGYTTLARIYSETGQWDKVHQYADSTLKLAKLLNDQSAQAEIYYLRGAEEEEKKNFSEAKKYYLQYLEIQTKQNNLTWISWTCTRISIVLSSMNQVDSAMIYAERSLKISQENNFNPDAAYEAFYHAYKAAHDYKNALKYYLLYDSLTNVSYNVNAGQSVAGVKARSEQEKKEAIAQLELKQQKLIKYISFAGIAVVVIFAFVLFKRFHEKRKANIILEKTLANLKSTQQQLVQSEKMASLGELTAGIAHEIQNPLNFVNNFSEVNKELIGEMKTEIEKGNLEEVKAIASDIESNEEKINHHGKRADAIVKGMLQHSRSSSGVKEPTDINALCDEYLRLSYHGLRAKDKSFNATMKTDFDNSIGNINIIPQDIGRVVLNLLTNAFYVVDEKKKNPQPPEGGVYDPTVSISTKKMGDKVEIKVSDNGNGIPQKVLDKIFQPFFTTKPTGQGTGLGLSLSYDIVKAHGGELKVETIENEGSEFLIQIPVI